MNIRPIAIGPMDLLVDRVVTVQQCTLFVCVCLLNFLVNQHYYFTDVQLLCMRFANCLDNCPCLRIVSHYTRHVKYLFIYLLT